MRHCFFVHQRPAVLACSPGARGCSPSLGPFPGMQPCSPVSTKSCCPLVYPWLALTHCPPCPSVWTLPWAVPPFPRAQRSCRPFSGTSVRCAAPYWSLGGQGPGARQAGGGVCILPGEARGALGALQLPGKGLLQTPWRDERNRTIWPSMQMVFQHSWWSNVGGRAAVTRHKSQVRDFYNALERVHANSCFPSQMIFHTGGTYVRVRTGHQSLSHKAQGVNARSFWGSSSAPPPGPSSWLWCRQEMRRSSSHQQAVAGTWGHLPEGIPRSVLPHPPSLPYLVDREYDGSLRIPVPGSGSECVRFFAAELEVTSRFHSVTCLVLLGLLCARTHIK